MEKFKKDTKNSPDEVLYEEALEDNKLGEEEDGAESESEMTETDDEIIEKFGKDKARMDEHWDPLYNEAEEDWDIYLLDQWSADGIQKRKGRPIVTVDMCRKYVKSVVAETFKNPPGVKLSARKDGASKKAQAMADAIRYFEDRTGSIYAYSFAKECAAVGGIGWLKVTYRYDEQQAMPAVIDVDRVDDCFSIKLDPDSRELDGSDSMCAYEDHGKKGKCTSVTYWWKDEEGRVKWAVIEDGKTIEDKGEWPGKDIPLIPVYGEIYRLRGKTQIFGLIRQLRDTQRSYNYALSEGIERLALTPKAPIQAMVGSISKQHEPDWQRSMIEPVPILYANPYDTNGNPLPMPVRSVTTPDTDWMVPLTQMLQQNAKETTGIFDTSFGAGPAEMSGTAIAQKTAAGDRGHLVYDEHLQVSVKHVGRIMLDLLEPVVTPGGMMPLLSEDGKVTQQEVGAPPVDMNGMQMGGQMDQNGMMMPPPAPELPDLDPSDLDISVSSAPAYATRKEEGLKNIMQMIERLPPEMASALIPKVIRDMDFPGSQEYSDLLNPQAGANDPQAQAQQMAQMQQQLAEAQAQMTQLTAQNQQLTMEIQNQTQAKMGVAQMDNQTKAQISAQHEQAETERLMMKLQADAQLAGQKLTVEVGKASAQSQTAQAQMAQQSDKDNIDIQLRVNQQQQQAQQQATQSALQAKQIEQQAIASQAQIQQQQDSSKQQGLLQLHQQLQTGEIQQQQNTHQIKLKGMDIIAPNPDKLG
jgi:hypothetical protein